MKRIAVVFLLLATLAAACFAQKPSATEVYNAAKKEGLKTHKNIFIAFDASW